jgi:arylsulfatase A-like enzyme
MKHSFVQTWRRVAGDLAVLLIVVHVPMVLLYTLRSDLMYMSPWEITKDTALFVAVYATLAAIIGLTIAALVTAIGRFSERAGRMTVSVLVWLYAALFVIVIYPSIIKWVETSVLQPLRRMGLPFPGKTMLYALAVLAVLALVLIVRRGVATTADSFSRSLEAAYKPVALLVLACALLAVATGQAAIRPFGWTAAADSAQAPAGAPDVILISIDTLAAKDMSLYGYALPTTPKLAAFAERAYVFDNFFANSNWTTPTVASFLTGLYPLSHRAVQMTGRVPSSVPTIASLLKAQGYATAAVVANPKGHPLKVNLADGFDYVSDVCARDAGRLYEYALTFKKSRLYNLLFGLFVPFEIFLSAPDSTETVFPAEMVSDQAMKVVDAGRRPLFLWAHFLSPHRPYLPPPPFRGRFLDSSEFTRAQDFNRAHGFYAPARQAEIDRMRLRYDEFLAYTDHEVSAFLERLDAAGLLSNAIVMITADHGESFEKGWVEHAGPMLHQALIHIPLIVRVPGQEKGARVASNAEQVDLLPTVMDLLQQPIPDWAEGESLRPAMQAPDHRSEKPKLSFEIAQTALGQKPKTGSVGIIQGPYKLTHRFASGCEELYALDADPNELNDLTGTKPEVAAELRTVLAARLEMPIVPRAERPADAQRADCSWSMQNWFEP